MKKSKLTILGISSSIIFTFSNIITANAGIYFIAKPEKPINSQNVNKPCILAGYTKNIKDCKDNQTLTKACPSNASYGLECGCDTSVYKYNQTNCTENKTLSGKSCENKYENCDCNLNVYKYYTGGQSCQSPMVIDYSDKCRMGNNQYAFKNCSCPAEYSETCSDNLIGIGTSCDVKYTSCQCNNSFMRCENGGEIGATSCTDGNGIKYTSCQPEISETCESLGYLSRQEGYVEGSWDIGRTSTNGSCFVYFYDHTHYMATPCEKETCVFEAVRNFSIVDGKGNIIKNITKGTKTAKFPITSSLYYMSITPGLKRGEFDTTPGKLSEGDSPLSQQNSWVDSTAKISNNIVRNDQQRIPRSVLILDEAEVSGNIRINTIPAVGDIHGLFIMRNNSKLSENAKVSVIWQKIVELKDNAHVYGNAQIEDNMSGVDGNIEIFDNAQIYGDASVHGEHIKIGGKSQIFGKAVVYGNYITISDNAIIKGNISSGTRIGGRSAKIEISGNAKVCGNVFASLVDRPIKISGDAVVVGKGAFVEGQAQVSGNAIIAGSARVGGDTIVSGTAKICSGTYTSGTYTSGSYGCEGYSETDFICE